MEEHRGQKKRLVGKAIQKYGWSNVKCEVVSYATLEEAYQHEADIVTWWFVRQRDNYNLSLGGVGPLMTDAIKAKISLTKLGHEVTQDTRDKISKTKTGVTYVHYETAIQMLMRYLTKEYQTLQQLCAEFDIPRPTFYEIRKGNKLIHIWDDPRIISLTKEV